MQQRRREWLRKVTGVTTTREIAARVGTSHTTVQRWIRSGVPPPDVTEICLRFGADIFEAAVTMGWIEEEELERLNFTSALQAVPQYVLTAELHRRASSPGDLVGSK